MSKHLERAVDELKKKILVLCSMVEENVRRAVNAIEKGDKMLARTVIDEDSKIDMMEIEIEEECLKILALHQPVAIDLRYIVAVLKLNNDLERIGDLSVNIAERALELNSLPGDECKNNLSIMAEKTRLMLKKSIDALINLDAQLARNVCASDEAVDDIYRRIFKQSKEEMARQPGNIDSFLHILSVARQLERMGDHATNIAEDVLYLVNGEIVRHRI